MYQAYLKDNCIMLSSRPIPGSYYEEYLHLKTNPLYQHSLLYYCANCYLWY